MDYSAIFGKRAGQYIEACERWPDARVEEFSAFFGYLKLQQGERLLDAPCGNGTLARYVSNLHQYQGVDPAPAFDRACKIAGVNCKKTSLRATGLVGASFDVVGSLTGVHHEFNRVELYQEWFRLLRPGGRLVIMDVGRATPVGEFLNGFVDRWNSNGHQGDFLHEADAVGLKQAGFERVLWADAAYSWELPTDKDMHAFMSKLFGLDLSPDLATMRHSWLGLGWRPSPGSCRIPWSLRLLTAVKARVSHYD